MLKKHILIFIIITVNYFNYACSLPQKMDDTVDWPAQRLYEKAQKLIQSGNNQNALEYLNKIQSRYPSDLFAQQALLDKIYIYYRENEPAKAIRTAEYFIHIYPLSRHVDYAYYMKALVNFRENDQIFKFLTDKNNNYSITDINVARQTYNDFAYLTSQFPLSIYALDSKKHMLLLYNALSEQEVKTAKYYLKHAAYVAAINRANYVLEHYPGTQAYPVALKIMVKAYKNMNIPVLANDSARILELNYPKDPDLASLKKILSNNHKHN